MSIAPHFTATQLRSIAEADSRINIWEGAIRSGKSIGSSLRWLAHLGEMHGKPGEAIVVGATRDSIDRNVFRPLQDPRIFGDLANHVKYTAGAPTARVLGQTVHVMGASDVRAELKIRGVTAKSVYADEVTVLPEMFFRQALGRMSVPGSKLFGTTNPGAPNHWLRRHFLLRADELDLQSWHFAIDDNTNLEPEIIAAIKAENTGMFYRRNVLGEWVAGEGVVFDMWDEKRHVVSELPPIEALLSIGVDYGTRNPFAALMLGLTVDGRLALTREWRHDPAHALRQLTDVDYSRAMRAWIGAETPRMLAVDPSAASFKLQLVQDRVGRVVDADNAVMDTIRRASSLLNTDQLIVHESCEGLRAEMPGYSWDEKAAEKGDDQPVKIDDHSIDAGPRYAVSTSWTFWRNRLRTPLPSDLAAA